mgnify:CR=1 FL=1
MKFGDRLSPALDIGFGKWFTPGIGIRFMYSGLTIKGATQNGSHSTGKVYDASQWLDEQKFDFMNIHGDVLFNARICFVVIMKTFLVCNSLCRFRLDTHMGKSACT